MSLTSPYRQHHYMGEYVSDSYVLSFIQNNKWDSTEDGFGQPQPGMFYFNTTINAMRVYNGQRWSSILTDEDVAPHTPEGIDKIVKNNNTAVVGQRTFERFEELEID